MVKEQIISIMVMYMLVSLNLVSLEDMDNIFGKMVQFL